MPAVTISLRSCSEGCVTCQGEYQEAITFYAMSGCYNHSIRLAKSFGLDSELMRYAVKSTPSLMIDCAIYFENKVS